jgi:hypothetical protein
VEGIGDVFRRRGRAAGGSGQCGPRPPSARPPGDRTEMRKKRKARKTNKLSLGRPPTVPGEEDDRSLGHTNHGSSGRGKAGFCPHTTKLSLARPPTVHGEEDDRSLGDTNHGSSGRGEAVFVCGRKTKGTEGKEKNGREEKEEGCERHTPYLWQRVRGPRHTTPSSASSSSWFGPCPRQFHSRP